MDEDTEKNRAAMISSILAIYNSFDIDVEVINISIAAEKLVIYITCDSLYINKQYIITKILQMLIFMRNKFSFIINNSKLKIKSILLFMLKNLSEIFFCKM